MNHVRDALGILTHGANWFGPSGLGARCAEHLTYSALGVGIALLIAVPLGFAVGHTRRGTAPVLATAGALRALPALGLLTWLAIALPGGVTVPLIPATIVLVFLAVAPLLAGIVAGFESVERDIVHSARAAGYSEAQILRRVELPLAAPVMIGGLRSCVVQVVATATVVAYIGLGGLGRLLVDGLAVQDYPRMVAGAVLVTGLALFIDVALAGVQRAIRPPGVVRAG
ncbi:Choline transport system permease protein OpuBB [Corynebacterium capitovis DSM 44611]|uniref:ABC transporter permease n=1 Tax=Corynebacterium capitovis TaxID=131081 RepID=UPI00035D5A22|nr:ABC transporter permease subunit [Corynebacterium capitovis]WKD57958.1 Choline transport system permease protein OpuBB [Corynebacterium capitovis DSM 44611]